MGTNQSRQMRSVFLCACLVAAVVAQDVKPITLFVNNGEGKDSTIAMGSSAGKATMHAKNNEFKLTMNGAEVMSYLPLESNTDNAFTEQVLGTFRMASLAANSIVAEDFEARSDDFPNQNWLAARADTFSNGTDGWRIVPVAVSDGESDNEDLTTTACGGVGQVLGGHCATSYHTIEKTYTNLPNHAEVQITARIHFLDNWDDDTMWMKMGLPGTVEQSPPVWAEEYTWCPQFFTFMCNAGVSTCGQEHYPDKMSRLVTVAMDHSAQDLQVQFGTNIREGTPACEVSYGISHITVEVR